MARRICVNRDVVIFAAMMSTECTNVIVNTLFKAASLKGMSSYVFLVYSYAIGALLLLPFALLSHRHGLLPPLSSSVLCKIGLLGLIASTYQMAGFAGIKLSSPSLASTMANLTPAFTFVLAIIFGMEKVDVKKKASIAKVVGTLLSIGGATVATLYHGPPLFSPYPPSVSLHQPLLQPPPSDWVIGGGLLALEFILISVVYILQAHIMSLYPSAVIMTCTRNMCMSVICALIGIIAEKNNPSVWIIRFDITLVAITTAGFLNVWFFTIHSWAVRYKGPLFLSMFKPVSILVAVAASVIFLGDSLFLGSVIGGTLISIGFYTVMWGKAREEKMDSKSSSIVSPPLSQQSPLLEDYKPIKSDV